MEYTYTLRVKVESTPYLHPTVTEKTSFWGVDEVYTPSTPLGCLYLSIKYRGLEGRVHL